MFVIRTACSWDVPAILRLLQGAGLREEGVDKHPDSFWVLEEIGDPPRIAGTLGMEVYGRTGLLRSFVVERERWNPQVVVKLLLLALSAARKRGIDELYLATAGSLPLFEAIGFSAVDGSELPDPIRASKHLRKVGKSGEAKVMRCILSQLPFGDEERGSSFPVQRDNAEEDGDDFPSSGSRNESFFVMALNPVRARGLEKKS
jgi:amino-acid N-acetyltransferase